MDLRRSFDTHLHSFDSEMQKIPRFLPVYENTVGEQVAGDDNLLFRQINHDVASGVPLAEEEDVNGAVGPVQHEAAFEGNRRQSDLDGLQLLQIGFVAGQARG